MAQFSYALRYVLDHLNTQEMCNQVASILVLDDYIKQDIRIKAIEVDPWSLYDVPDLLKTKKNV